jgi:hypothetical protein
MYRKEAIEVDHARCSDNSAEANIEVLAKFSNDLMDRIFASTIPR